MSDIFNAASAAADAASPVERGLDPRVPWPPQGQTEAEGGSTTLGTPTVSDITPAPPDFAPSDDGPDGLTASSVVAPSPPPEPRPRWWPMQVVPGWSRSFA